MTSESLKKVESVVTSSSSSVSLPLDCLFLRVCSNGGIASSSASDTIAVQHDSDLPITLPDDWSEHTENLMTVSQISEASSARIAPRIIAAKLSFVSSDLASDDRVGDVALFDCADDDAVENVSCWSLLFDFRLDLSQQHD